MGLERASHAVRTTAILHRLPEAGRAVQRLGGGLSFGTDQPERPKKRDLLGTVLLSVLAGHRRYAHITAFGCDPVNPPLLGMRKVVSEDSVRRGLARIGEAKGLPWLQNHLDYCTTPLLGEPWVLDRICQLSRHEARSLVNGAGPLKRLA